MNAREFRDAMAALPEPPDGQPPDWAHWRHSLWSSAQSEPVDLFMSWPVTMHTLMVNHLPVENQLRYLQQDWERWDSMCQVPLVGSPMDIYPTTVLSRNMIEQAYHVKLFEDTAGKRIDRLESIFEFGGGYGALALVANRLGFRGPYVIYDYPEFALLQDWFLSQHDIGVRRLFDISPNYYIKCDLFVAAHGLDETDEAFRTDFMRHVDANSYLFFYANERRGYDNHAWFTDLAHKYKHVRWTWHELSDRPDQYLIGIVK